MKLFTRYNRIILPLLVLLFLVTAFTTFLLVKKVLQNELDGILLRSQTRIENYVKDTQRLPSVFSFDDQKVIFEKLNGPLTDSGLSSTTQYIPEQHKDHISRQLVFGLALPNQNYKVVITEPLEGTHHLTILIAKIAVVTIFAILLVLLMVNRMILTRLWRPFYESLSIFRNFKLNNSGSLQFPRSSTEEFELMNEHFKMAADNAVKDYKNLKEFSENASHEIQTPLAIIRSNLDLLAQQENLTEKQSELLQAVYGSVTKLSKLQQSLLLLTKIDNRQFHESREVRLDLILNDKMIQFQELWQGKEIKCTATLSETPLTINNELLDILLNNLFSNATRHNIPGGYIMIAASGRSMTIGNTGIAESLDQSRIFRRFYKNVVINENNGLGLSIVKEICDVSAIKILYDYENGFHQFCLSW